MIVNPRQVSLTQQWREMVARLSDHELAVELMALPVSGLECRSIQSTAVTTEAARRLRERT